MSTAPCRPQFHQLVQISKDMGHCGTASSDHLICHKLPPTPQSTLSPSTSIQQPLFSNNFTDLLLLFNFNNSFPSFFSITNVVFKPILYFCTMILQARSKTLNGQSTEFESTCPALLVVLGPQIVLEISWKKVSINFSELRKIALISVVSLIFCLLSYFFFYFLFVFCLFFFCLN